MRICIFSDIHGNYEALHKMLKAEQGDVEKFIFAGDIFGYFYNQSEIIRDLMNLPDLLAVKGNHDKYYLTCKGKTNLLDKYGSSYLLKLTDSQRDFMASMPEYISTEIAGKRIGIFHGGPEDYVEQRIYPDTKVDFASVFEEYDIVILGHTHYRMEKRMGHTLILNPGSLGQPRDGKGFSYCVLDLEDETCCFKAVDIQLKELLLQVKEKDADKTAGAYLLKKYGSLEV